MYSRVKELEQLWDDFEPAFLGMLQDANLQDIKKLMTAVSVIDLNAHAIYEHTAHVHRMTKRLLQLQKDYPKEQVNQLCARWLNLLKKRNEIPLHLKHHQRLDGTCDFRYSLQLMEGKPHGFKEIQVLDHHNPEEIEHAIHEMHRLDCAGLGFSFGELAGVNNNVITSLMKCDDVICLLAKDQNDQVVGHCWGMLLRDVPVGKREKANVFWVFELTRDPDFIDDHIKVGDQLRSRMVELLKTNPQCDFVGYQHILNHKFHMDIVGDMENDSQEQLRIRDDRFTAKTGLNFDEDLGLYMRAHFIRANEKNLPYPEYKNIKPAILKAFWAASQTVKDFVVGGISFFRRMNDLKKNHSMLEQPIAERLTTTISEQQKNQDATLFRQIILSDMWLQYSSVLFGERHPPDTIQALQNIILSSPDLDFQAVKARAADHGKCWTRKSITAVFYDALAAADSPTYVLDSLLKSEATPREWIDSITAIRHAVQEAEAGFKLI